MVSRLAFIVCVGFGGASLGGCAHFAAEYARAEALTQALDGYTIPKPLEEAWPQAVTVQGPHDSLLWSAQGWSWRETSKFHMRTAKKTDTDKGTSERTVTDTWLEAVGTRSGDGCQIRYFEVKETTRYRGKERLGADKSRDRRPDLELELVKQFDPKSARRIEAKGEAAAQRELND